MMKKLFWIICLIVIFVEGAIAQEEGSKVYHLSRATFQSTGSTVTPLQRHDWKFLTDTDNKTTISIKNGVGGETSGNPIYNEERMEFFPNVQFQIEGIPSNETITKISFTGIAENGSAYLSELNGISSSEASGQFLEGTTDNTVSQVFEDKGIGRSCTFTFGGNKVCIKDISITTKTISPLTDNNKDWNFTNGYGSDFVFGETELSGYTFNSATQCYDTGKGSNSSDFHYILLKDETELTATVGIQVNGRNQIFKDAIGVLGTYSLKIHVECGQKIILTARTHRTKDTPIEFKGVKLMNEWGTEITEQILKSKYDDYLYVAKESGDLEIKNNTDTYLYIEKIALSNFQPHIVWQKDENEVNTSKGNGSYINKMQCVFPSDTDVKFYIKECGEGTVTWSSFDSSTGEIKGIQGTGGLLIGAYFMASDYFLSSENTYVLNVTEGAYFAEKEVSTKWTSAGYVIYSQKLSGLTQTAAPIYSVESCPEGWNAKITQDAGSPEYILTVTGSGSGEVTVKGKYGTEEDTYTLSISGLSFKDNAPSISNEATTFQQTVTESEGGTVTYEIGTKVGDVSATINPSTGELTDIQGNGAIQVIAKSGDLSAEYVLTVAYDNHEWNFYANPLNLTQNGRLGETPANIGDATLENDLQNYDHNFWTKKYKSYQYTDGVLSYFKEPIFAYKNPVDGDNALIISETAGLQFKCDAEEFGIQNNADNKHYRNVKFSSGAKLTIPKLKKGKYVMIYWDPYAGAQGGSGATFNVTNLTDLEGKDITTTFKIPGIAGDWNQGEGTGSDPWGATSFQVKEDGDVTLTIADNGWNDILKIVVSDTYDVPFQAATNNWVTGSGFKGIAISTANHNNTLLAGQNLRISGYPQETHSMSACTPEFRIADGSNLVDAETIVEKSNRGVEYNIFSITAKKGCYGNVLVSQTIYCNGYAFEKKEVWLAIGDLTTQTYPYTWDFTQYNCNWKNAEGGNTNATVLERKETGYGYGDWEKEGMGIKTSYSYWTKKWADGTWKGNSDENLVNTTDIDKPLFANGSNLHLSKSDYYNVIKETEGLGIIVDNSNIDADKAVANKDINLTEDQYGTSMLKLSPKDIVKIPSVEAGMLVFINCDAATGGPTVSCSAGVGSITQGWENGNELINKYSPKAGIHVYKVNQTGDVLITGVNSIYRIGVTNMVKAFSKVGKATESRDCLIDYSQSGVFTRNALTAYYAEGQDQYDDNKNIINLSEIKVMKAEKAGLLLYNEYKENGNDVTEHANAFEVPLFVPAVNITTTAFGYNANNEQNASPLKAYLKRDHNLEASDKDNNRFIFTNVKYDITDKNETKKDTELGFYIVRKSGLMSKDNQAYLELPTSLFSTVNTAKGYVRLSFDEETTGIKNVETPEALPNKAHESRFGKDVYYNIDGTRLAGKPTHKGIYIYNGKKIAIK